MGENMYSDVVVGMFGPEWPEGRTEDAEVSKRYGIRVAIDRAPFMVNAGTFGRALEIYCRYFKCALEVFSGPFPDNWGSAVDENKYFRHTPSDGESRILDIHILRDGQEICPKQNLDYPLLDGDIIEVGAIRIC